jgi:hypothetical protein
MEGSENETDSLRVEEMEDEKPPEEKEELSQ